MNKLLTLLVIFMLFGITLNCGGSEDNGNGGISGQDQDNDGIPDDQENDQDDDGIPDDQVGDLDNDGIPDDQDIDLNNDGIPDEYQTGDALNTVALLKMDLGDLPDAVSKPRLFMYPGTGYDSVTVTISGIAVHKAVDCTPAEDGDGTQNTDNDAGMETSGEGMGDTGVIPSLFFAAPPHDAGVGDGGSHETDGGSQGDPDSGTGDGDGGADSSTADSGEADNPAEWIIISETEQTFDLIQLQGGITAALGLGALNACHYTQVRLFVTLASFVKDGVEYPLEVPSESIKLTHGFVLTAGFVLPMTLDFDAEESIHETEGGKYILNPTIKIVEGEAYPVEEVVEPEEEETTDDEASATEEDSVPTEEDSTDDEEVTDIL